LLILILTYQLSKLFPYTTLFRSFNKDGQLLLTQRSMSKMLWPGDWDGTVASHPRQSETYVSSAERRLPEELGITCKLDYLFKFEDRKSTRLNSSHEWISYAVFCL